MARRIDLAGGCLALSLAGVWAGLGAGLWPGAAAAQEALVLPSGQSVTLVETLSDAMGTDGSVLRYRFLAPAIAASVDAESALADIAWICANYALPRLAQEGQGARQVVISMMDRDVPFGETDEEAVQYFDSFDVSGGACEVEIVYD